MNPEIKAMPVRERIKRLMLIVAAWWHIPAWAADRSPLDIPLREYLLVLLASLLGGFVSWFARFKRGHTAAASVMVILGEACTSAFAGLMAFWLCGYFNLPSLVTICTVGMAGHMGARAIAAGERVLEKRIGKLAGETGPGSLK